MTSEYFAEAVAMLARLSLTDAERAEAVRRLLVGTDATAAQGAPRSPSGDATGGRR